MKFALAFEIDEKDKDNDKVKEAAINSFAVEYFKQIKDKAGGYVLEVLETEKDKDGKKVKVVAINITMELINFKDVIKPKKDNSIFRKEKIILDGNNLPKEKQKEV